ncbi:MAG: hypothetical protein AAB797_01310 [Patescibacteria group bacterium]
MKKLYLVLKILIILAALIAVGYLATTPDSEVILKRPWFEKTGDTDYNISKKVYSGDIWEVYKDGRKVLWLQNEPGFLISAAILPAGTEPAKHQFVNAKALDPLEENNLQKLLAQSQGFEEYLYLLDKSGYILKMAGSTLTIRSNTQGQYGGDLRIGAGNIGIHDYEIDGVKKTGLTATLWVSVRDKSAENKTITVYIGQSFEINKYKITVHDIQGELVTLRIWDVSK